MGTTSAAPTLALVGATGLVAESVLRVVGMREEFWGEVRLLSPDPGSEQTGTVRGEAVPVRRLSAEALSGVDVAVLNLPPEAGATWAREAVAAGAVVVDNSGGHRGDAEVPLVVPEVNPAKVRSRPAGIVAMPGPLTLTLIDVAHVLHSGWELTELVVTAMLAASSADERGIDRLYAEIEALAGRRQIGQLSGDVRAAVAEALPGDSPFPAPLAMNLIPHVGEMEPSGWTSEEHTLADETRSVLGAPDLDVVATCVQVPVVSTHSVSVHATLAGDVDVDAARQALVEAPAVVALDDRDGAEFPTPVDTVGADPRFTGRLRQDAAKPNTLELFVCADTLRRGAMGMVLTAELIGRELAGAPG